HRPQKESSVSMVVAVDSTARLLDQARRAVLEVTMRSRPLRALLIDRGSRVGLMTGLAFVSSAVLALYAPWLSLLAGTILFGIPHVLSDVRYLLLGKDRTFDPGTARIVGALFAGGAVLGLLAMWSSSFAAPMLIAGALMPAVALVRRARSPAFFA